jgi:DNA mismatch endonuclease (patch repair protein)
MQATLGSMKSVAERYLQEKFHATASQPFSSCNALKLSAQERFALKTNEPGMDRVDRKTRSRNMAHIRNRNTGPELTVRSFLHARGYRYRLHGRKLPGKPDLVFAGRRKVLFVHGCFWHQHDGCHRAFRPKSRAQFWNAKLAANVRRDRDAVAALELDGWNVLTVWECELKRPAFLGDVVVPFLGPVSC